MHRISKEGQTTNCCSLLLERKVWFMNKPPDLMIPLLGLNTMDINENEIRKEINLIEKNLHDILSNENF